MENTF